MAYEPAFFAGLEDFPNSTPMIFFVVKRGGAWTITEAAPSEINNSLYSGTDLVLLDQDGNIHISTDGGTVWTDITPIGPPWIWYLYKLSITQPTVFLSDSASDILQSSDLLNWASVGHANLLGGGFTPAAGIATVEDDQGRMHLYDYVYTSLGHGLYTHSINYVRTDDNCVTAAQSAEVCSLSNYHYASEYGGQTHSFADLWPLGITANGNDVFIAYYEYESWYEYTHLYPPYPEPDAIRDYFYERSRLKLAYSHNGGADWANMTVREKTRTTYHWSRSNLRTYSTDPYFAVPIWGWNNVVTLCTSPDTLFISIHGADGLPTWASGDTIIYRYKSTDFRSGVPTFEDDIAYRVDGDVYGFNTPGIDAPQLWDNPTTAFLLTYYLVSPEYDVDHVYYLVHFTSGTDQAADLRKSIDYYIAEMGQVIPHALSGVIRNRSFWW